MELTRTTPALPKNIHMSYEYELIVCQSDKEAIETYQKVSLKHFFCYLPGKIGSRAPSIRLAGCWVGQLFGLDVIYGQGRLHARHRTVFRDRRDFLHSRKPSSESSPGICPRFG